MQITRAHRLSKSEARRRIEELTNYWHRKHGVRVSWQGDRAQLLGSVKGIDFEAEIVVGEDKVQATASDPGWLFRSHVKKYVGEKIEEYLDA